MGEFYSGVNIVGMVKETIEVFFRLGRIQHLRLFQKRVVCTKFDIFFFITHKHTYVYTDDYASPTDESTGVDNILAQKNNSSTVPGGGGGVAS